MNAPTVRRPGLITLLVVLTIIGGIISIVTGILTMVVLSGISWIGIVFIALGLIYLAVAKGLADGNPVSRMIVAVVAVVQLVFGIFTIFFRTDDQSTNSAWGTVIWSVILLVILFSAKANVFFGARSR
jgi:hypothetical protein